jgi:uncharacterized protein (TIGR02271 family)
VIDSNGDKIGSVDNVWVDDATNALEFVGVHTGWLFGKTHVIPMENAQIDGSNQAVQVPYDQDLIKDAPSFDGDAELSPDDENTIYSYYGMDRTTAPSPSGLATNSGITGSADGESTTGQYADDTAGTNSYADAGTTGTYDATANADATTAGTYDTTDTSEQRVQLAEEQLNVGKRAVQAGSVRLRKVVRTEEVEQPVELQHEEIDIERVPVSETTSDVASNAFQEQEIEVPVMREEPVVEKQARVTGEVRVGKDVETETRTVGGQVRQEDVEVDRDVDTDNNLTAGYADNSETTR